MTLKEIIVRYREENGLSQRQFATTCGLSNGYISMIECEVNPKTGEKITPTLPALQKLATGMNITLSDLLSQIDDILPRISDKSINQEVGKRIEFRRKQLGLTLEDIAAEIGVARSTIQRYEKGNIGKLKMPVIEAIARVLDVNPAWLSGRNQDSSQPNLENELLEAFRRLSERDKISWLTRIEDYIQENNL